jgi:hypothetical protein
MKREVEILEQPTDRVEDYVSRPVGTNYLLFEIPSLAASADRLYRTLQIEPIHDSPIETQE